MNSSIARARWRDDARRRDDATTRRDALSGRDGGFRKEFERDRTRETRRGRRARARGRALKNHARGAAVDGVERRARAGGGRAGRFEGLGV